MSSFLLPRFPRVAPHQPQIMAYYLLTVLEQDDGVEVQRLVKDLVRSRVSLGFECLCVVLVWSFDAVVDFRPE